MCREAAGEWTGNDELPAQGKADQELGKFKQVAEKVEQAVKKVRE